MEVIHLNTSTIINDNLVVTIGQFDGIHKAHQCLIQKTVSTAQSLNAKSAVITFTPHIDTVLKNLSPNDYIIDFESKKELLVNLNVDYLLIIDFNANIAKINHSDFFLQYINNLNILEFIVGFDFSYGHLGLGNVSTIQDDYIKPVNVTTVSKLELINEKIGSFEIKKALKEGNIKMANELLGYHFFINFEITQQTSNKVFLSSLNINLLKKQNYLVLINNQQYLLDNNDQTFIENFNNIYQNKFIKVIFLS